MSDESTTLVDKVRGATSQEDAFSPAVREALKMAEQFGVGPKEFTVPFTDRFSVFRAVEFNGTMMSA
jgi:hypothetical protein